MEILDKNLRTEEEKRQDAFGDFLSNAQSEQKARIKFCGEKIKVRVNYRRLEDFGGVRPDNQRVSLKVLTQKGGEFPKNLVFDTIYLDNTELIRIY